MPRRARHAPLNVFLNARRVGRLRREPSGAIEFRYDADWLGWENTFAISLSLPLREARFTGNDVIAVFDNLLPDSDPIRRRVAERMGAEGTDAYSLLAAIGKDCVGALQFLPDGEDAGPAGHVAGKPISSREIARKLGDLASNPLGLDADEDFRISIAGAQEKTALLRWDGKWMTPIGTTATTHIFKPQIGQLPNGLDLSNSVENEYFCLKLTAALGLPSANVEMASFGERRVLIVERFDRQITRDDRLLRLPQEDCCQALGIPPTRKYEAEGGPGIPALLSLLRDGDTPDEDQRRLFMASVVFWLMGATDGHAKNFSIFLSPGGGYRMTPLYDVLSAQPSLIARQLQPRQMKLAMAVGKNRHFRISEIVPRHFEQTAALARMGKPLVADVFRHLVANGADAIEQTLKGLPRTFPAAVSETIAEGFVKRLKLVG
jgi:serine/threonine-protein kinase HipA